MDYIQYRKLKILLLARAKDRILAEGDVFICDALRSICINDPLIHNLSEYSSLDIHEAIGELRQYIRNAILPFAYYHEWLCLKQNTFCFDHMRLQEFKQGRIAWINWMIACYEEDIANYKDNHETAT